MPITLILEPYFSVFIGLGKGKGGGGGGGGGGKEMPPALPFGVKRHIYKEIGLFR